MKMKMLMTVALVTLGMCVGAGEVTSIVARERYPWNGLVDLQFTIQGVSGTKYDTSITAKDFSGGTNLTMKTLFKADGTAANADGELLVAGTYNWVWDVTADIGEVKIADVAIAVECFAPEDPQLGGVQLWENGPYWAECNVGATKPEESGYYFWWGDTVGYSANSNSATWKYDWGNGVEWVSSKGVQMSVSPFSSSVCLTCDKTTAQLQSAGYIDSTGNLVAVHDAAAVHLGAPWRMPTYAEFSELISNCTTTWDMQNGAWGWRVTGKGAYSSRSIFLPAVGFGNESFFSNSGSYGYYWSSTLRSGYGACELFFYGGNSGLSYNSCDDGFPVRPLRGFSSTTTTHLMTLGGGATGDEVTVTGVTAQQRYPWNGLVDVTVTLFGTSNNAAHAACTFVAIGSATKHVAWNVSHVTGDSVVSGSGNTWIRRFVWDVAADIGEVKIDDVALTVECIPTVDPQLGGVQLWENGPYWAECNVGASKPEESGYYFWWGDTIGYKRNASNDGWVSVADGMSFSFSGGNCPICYKDNPALQSLGYIDSTGNLVAAHDAATTHLGAPWRMPTDAEFSALISNCTKTWITTNGVSGQLVTGRGAYSSKSIFLPAVGYGSLSDLCGPSTYGGYWSSTPYSGYSTMYACDIRFYSNSFNQDYYERSYGLPARPLRGLASSSATTHFALDCGATGGEVTATGVIAQQRYPWNGMVDITVTLSGASNDVAQAVCMFVAINSATHAALNVSHVTGDSVVSGSGNTWTRRFVWDATADIGEVKIDDVALTVKVTLGCVQLWENGPYWAECNVGATKPEKCGYYFWWGDTVGYSANTNNATLQDFYGWWGVKWVSSKGGADERQSVQFVCLPDARQDDDAASVGGLH